MCSNTKSFLDSVEDFILNQDKIVTYKWLSKKLNIHANTSKQLLYTFSTNCTEEKLLVTYLVSGRTDDGLEVYVVSQSEVDKVKKSLISVISEHVYSVQKASTCISSSDLYLADSSIQTSTNKFSGISERAVEERDFKVRIAEKPSGQVQQSKLQPKVPNGLSCGSKENRKDKINEQPFEQYTKKEEKKATQAKTTGIGALFSKQIEKKKNESPPKKLMTEEVVEAETEKSDVTLEVCQPSTADLPHNEPLLVNKTPVSQKNKHKKPKNKKRKNNGNEYDTPAKKRKRIVLASDSEDEVDEEEEEKQFLDEEPEEPQEQPNLMEVPDSDDEDEVIPPTPYGEKTKRRIRKQVDKTFMDEEGFVITKKEYVYISCSEEEEGKEPSKPNTSTTELNTPNEGKEQKTDEISPKKNEEELNPEGHGKSDKGQKVKAGRKAKKTKMSSPKKVKETTKQASIMSFFTKK